MLKFPLHLSPPHVLAVGLFLGIRRFQTVAQGQLLARLRHWLLQD